MQSVQKILHIVGARPNFMKIAPFVHAINRHNQQSDASDQPSPTSTSQPSGLRSSPFSSFPKVEHLLVHTGQHYDERMSGDFFRQLGIPDPDVNLEVGSGTQAEQTAAIMVRYEQLLLKARSDVCLVVGDVTSTLAGALVAAGRGVGGGGGPAEGGHGAGRGVVGGARDLELADQRGGGAVAAVAVAVGVGGVLQQCRWSSFAHDAGNALHSELRLVGCGVHYSSSRVDGQLDVAGLVQAMVAGAQTSTMTPQSG